MSEVYSSKREQTFQISVYSILCVCLIAIYLPVLTMIVQSLRVGEGFEFGLKWYIEVLQDSVMIESVLRSVTIAAIAATLSSSLGFLASLAPGRAPKWLAEILLFQSSIALAIPELILALSLLILFSALRLELGYFTVILAHVTLTLPFASLILSARAATLNPEIEQAARDLGASEFQILRKVTFPMMTPALISAFTLSYLLSFDDFLVTFFVNGVGLDTLPVKLYTSMKAGQSPRLHALAVSLLIITGLLSAPLVRSFAKTGRPQRG